VNDRKQNGIGFYLCDIPTNIHMLDVRSHKMKNPILLIIIAIFLTGLVLAPEVIGQDRSCQFEAAGPDDVYLVIREETGSGETREYVMWEGWVKKYQQKQYTSQTGQVAYDYKLSSDDRTIGDNHSPCADGNTIRIP